ncbi:hypothetical protein C7S18_12080 [Ahniella affigens]|uniref:TIGR02001 family outer membrane protein n=1 Tax=Ahniella affigens TaxID=2021234 RepID=A0A2P1PSU7_9GAMM|nr:TorF family putative porin [Ahniella affigens]AVP97890.1 hypothetical protein C7S18_12080 [Ahniella affigens]
MFKKSMLASALLLAASGAALAQEDEASATWTTTLSGTLTSDYVFRGISQSQESAALQGGVTVAHESGFYAGVWGSSVDFTPSDSDFEDDANFEIDVSAGYAWEFGEGFSGDVMLVRYFYPGTEEGFDYNYNELIGTFGYNDFVFVTLGYSNDVFNTDATGIYYGVNGSYALPWWELEVTGELGRYDLSDDVGLESYTHFGVGVGRSWGPVSASINWTNSDDNAEDNYGEIADAHWFASISLETDM